MLDRIDHKFRHLAQVNADLGLAVLGTVPKIAQPPRRAKPEEAAEVIESFRGIRLRLQYAYTTTQPLVCGVTSPEQGDGKSLVASNLALAFAEAGYRTLLIEPTRDAARCTTCSVRSAVRASSKCSLARSNGRR